MACTLLETPETNSLLPCCVQVTAASSVGLGEQHHAALCRTQGRAPTPACLSPPLLSAVVGSLGLVVAGGVALGKKAASGVCTRSSLAPCPLPALSSRGGAPLPGGAAPLGAPLPAGPPADSPEHPPAGAAAAHDRDVPAPGPGAPQPAPPEVERGGGRAGGGAPAAGGALGTSGRQRAAAAAGGLTAGRQPRKHLVGWLPSRPPFLPLRVGFA